MVSFTRAGPLLWERFRPTHLWEVIVPEHPSLLFFSSTRCALSRDGFTPSLLGPSEGLRWCKAERRRHTSAVRTARQPVIGAIVSLPAALIFGLRGINQRIWHALTAEAQGRSKRTDRPRLLLAKVASTNGEESDEGGAVRCGAVRPACHPCLARCKLASAVRPRRALRTN